MIEIILIGSGNLGSYFLDKLHSNEKLILKAAVPLYDQTEPYNNRYGIIAK